MQYASTYKDLQAIERKQRNKDILYFIIAAAFLLAIFFTGKHQYDVANAEYKHMIDVLQQSESDERFARTGSRMCYQDGQEFDATSARAGSLVSMSSKWCRSKYKYQ